MQHPDLSIVQSEMVGRNIKINQVRELHHRLSLTPYEATFRIALILRFEEANQNAANALLKLLEEPPPKVVMLLTAQEAEILLPTIVSRCELIRLRPLSIPEIVQGLQEQYDVSVQNATSVGHISGGRPGYALRLLQNPEYLKERKNWLEEHLRLLSANRVERSLFAEEISKNTQGLESILQIWSSYWRDVLLVVSGSSTPITNIDYQGNIQDLAGKVDLSTSRKIVEACNHTQKLIRQNVNTRLAMEVLVLNLPFT
jgi:DNA polymerase-3 subunit delta'